MTDQELKEVIQEIKNSTMPIPTQQKVIDELEGSIQGESAIEIVKEIIND